MAGGLREYGEQGLTERPYGVVSGGQMVLRPTSSGQADAR
jgi:hypothetical protein